MSDGAGWLRSARALDGAVSLDEAFAWFESRADDDRSTVQIVALDALPDWGLTPDCMRLSHRSGRFFSVCGFRLDGADGQRRDQPLIDQPEVGVLGFATRVIRGVRHLLMQAKMEPGNVRRVQLAPTVQATHSNYTRVHGGRPVARLDRFLVPGRARVWADVRQPEQGSYFLAKYNRNIVVELADPDVAPEPHECWMTLGQLRAFLRLDYAVNMDARSVLSCLPFADADEVSRLARPVAGLGDGRPHGWGPALVHSSARGAPAEHSWPELRRWLVDASRTPAGRSLQPRRLDALDGWTLTGDALTCTGPEEPFGVIGVEVANGRREVDSWAQPMLSRNSTGLLGLLTQYRAGSMHLLVRAVREPGLPGRAVLAPTVLCHHQAPSGAGQADLFRWFTDGGGNSVRFSAVHSEEGGRFFRFAYRYVIVEAATGAAVELPPDARWLTVEQVQRFVASGSASVELRNLLACMEPAQAS